MLISLHIKNIAVIDEVEVEFCEGFNVLTGETGAGKSIIIDSINMVLGQRTSRELIRNGEQKAVVEAMFYIDNPEILTSLEELGVEAEDGNLLIYRDLNIEGRGNSRINGMMVTAGMLKEISKLIINIHGQQDNQSLLTPSNHTEYLDSYAGIMGLRHEYKEVFYITKGIEKRIDNSKMDEQEKARKVDLLQFQISEIEDAKLKPNEEEELNERRDFLGSSNKISSVLEGARNALYTNDINTHDLLSNVVNSFGEIARYDEKLSQFFDTLNSINIDLDDIIYQIRDYADNIEFNPNELDEIEGRLNLIHNLKRKYGASISDILKYYDKISIELEDIVQSDELINKLKEELEISLKIQKQYADQITQKRLQTALSLQQKIMDELSDLDMTKVKFKVDVKPTDFSPTGADSVEFLISTNAGEPLKPLSKIASGGEMSRIMLAIKSILADTDSVTTLIFDEIDTGVSGRAAQKIAQKIDKISYKKQILCITHLAQIASMAGTHFLIEKGMTDNATKTNVIRLSKDERISELARIIGGAQITELTMSNAKEMLQLAEDYKIGENRNSNKN